MYVCDATSQPAKGTASECFTVGAQSFTCRINGLDPRAPPCAVIGAPPAPPPPPPSPHTHAHNCCDKQGHAHIQRDKQALQKGAECSFLVRAIMTLGGLAPFCSTGTSEMKGAHPVDPR